MGRHGQRRHKLPNWFRAAQWLLSPKVFRSAVTSHNLGLRVVMQYGGPKLPEHSVMKYVLLIYQARDYNPQALSADEHKAVAAQYGAVNRTPNVKPGLPLGFVKDAITVRVRDGQAVAARGPYVEHPGGTVGGYYEFEAETDEEAIRLAAQIPAASQGGAVEIRPSRTYW
jgi:hypothetical protein